MPLPRGTSRADLEPSTRLRFRKGLYFIVTTVLSLHLLIFAEMIPLPKGFLLSMTVMTVFHGRFLKPVVSAILNNSGRSRASVRVL